MILKAKEYSLGGLNKEIIVYTLIKIKIVFFERKIEEIV